MHKIREDMINHVCHILSLSSFNIMPLISGRYGLRNHFWPLESRFLMRKNEKKSIFSKPPNLPILSFWILNLHIIICQFQKNPPRYIFFVSVHVPATSETEKDFVACFIDEQYDSAKVSLSLFVLSAVLKQESQLNCGWTESKCPPLKAPPASRKLTAAGFTGAPNISPIFHNLGPSLL